MAPPAGTSKEKKKKTRFPYQMQLPEKENLQTLKREL